jgi:hypothetical protein
MMMYRPGFEFTASSSDYDFQTYVKDALERFKASRQFKSPFRKENN